MTKPPFPMWTTAASDAAFTDPAACAVRASEFERQIARRNRRERAAGWFQLPFWGLFAAFFLWRGEWLIGLSAVLIGLGVMVVLRNLRRRADNLARKPEEACVAHLVRQYRHQYDALIAVPVWYIGPLVPGMVAFFAAVTAAVAGQRGWAVALEGLWLPASFACGVLVIIAALNLAAARQLKRELERLERLA